MSKRSSGLLSGWLMVALAVTGLMTAESLAVPSTKDHPRRLIAANTAVSGKELFDKKACSNCHSVGGKGGCLAPVLDGIGALRSKDYIIGRISSSSTDRKKFEKVFKGMELMEHVRLSPEESRSIASYLVSLPKPAKVTATGHSGPEDETDWRPAGSAFVPAEQSPSSREGAVLYQKFNCSVCHTIRDLGGRLGPPLDGIGARRSRNFIQGRMRTGAMEIVQEAADGKSSRLAMPPQMLTDSEIGKITDYLLTLPPSNAGASKSKSRLMEMMNE